MVKVLLLLLCLFNHKAFSSDRCHHISFEGLKIDKVVLSHVGKSLAVVSDNNASAEIINGPLFKATFRTPEQIKKEEEDSRKWLKVMAEQEAKGWQKVIKDIEKSLNVTSWQGISLFGSGTSVSNSASNPSSSPSTSSATSLATSSTGK